MTWLILVVLGVQSSRASISHHTLPGNWGNGSVDLLNWFVLWILSRHCCGILEVNEVNMVFLHYYKKFLQLKLLFSKAFGEYSKGENPTYEKLCCRLHINK
jgi:hypothetical protein